jgi:uncharacterized protein YjbI with pentapeptide repeats
MALFGAGTAWGADCASPARPGVDWRTCDKRHLTLDEGDPTGARLRDTSFRDARMRGVILEGAQGYWVKVNHADLTDARLASTNLRDADLSGALWIDGKTRC